MNFILIQVSDFTLITTNKRLQNHKVSRNRITSMGVTPERGKSILEGKDTVITVPSSATNSAPPRDNVEENPVHVDQGFAIHDEEDYSIRPDETPGDYYY
ncbi:hypothetical protein Hanom_Chr10g00924351 [Helianthus anomalus]